MAIDEAVFAHWVHELRSLGVGTLREHEPMARHTTYRIGGPARIYVEPDGYAATLRLLAWAKTAGAPCFFLGQGSNMLVSDQGLNAVVVETNRGLLEAGVSGNRVKAEAGVLLTRLAHLTARHGLTGLEFAISIPGSLGGAVFMNAGAHGSSMEAVVDRVWIWDGELGQVRIIDKAEARFQYRHSALHDHSWIALAAEMALEPGDGQQVREKLQHLMAVRKQTQPLGDPNAGSMFRNPLPAFAGQLVEGVGAKGWRVGDAQVSEVHANFIVNRGSARAIDVLTLMRRIRCVVFQKHRVVLRPEVRWVGPPEGGNGATWENLWYAEGQGLQEPCT